MTLKLKVLGSLLFALTNAVQGQLVSRHAGYIELLGNSGGFISINYERIMWPSSEERRFTLAARAGLSASSAQYDRGLVLHVPIELCAYTGTKRWRPDIGIGYTAFFGFSDLSDDRIPEEYKSNYGSWFVVRAGVRRIGNGGFLLRISPLYIWESHSNGRHSDFWGGGVSVGSYF